MYAEAVKHAAAVSANRGIQYRRMPNHKEYFPPYLQDILEDNFGKKLVRWTIPDCGLSAALRFSVQMDDRSHVFVKAATDEETAKWLRTEYTVLSAVRGKCMPHVIKWIDRPGIHPILVTQDLSGAYWPASHRGVIWRDGDFDVLFSGIQELSGLEVPAGLPVLQNGKHAIWSKIAINPKKILNIGICSEKWLGRSINALIEAEKIVDTTGNQLVHGDVRSDNVCFVDSQAMFVDWSHAALGNRLYDLASVLPTIHLEGGPVPYEIMPAGGSYAALWSARHIRRVIKDRTMPSWLERVFVKLIAIELEWAAACLELDQPDGLSWRAM